MELTTVVRDVRSEGVDRSGVALEAVDPAIRKLGEELERIGAVVAPDLENHGVVTTQKVVDLSLREPLLTVRHLQRSQRSTRQELESATQPHTRVRWRDSAPSLRRWRRPSCRG